MKKYEDLAFLFNIENNFDFRRQLSNSHYSLKKFSESYDKIYFLDFYSLKLFKKRNNLDRKILVEFNLDKNVEFISFKSFFELIKFFKRKKIVGISFGFGTAYNDLLIHFFLRFFDIKHIQIQNVGNHQIIQTKSVNKFKAFFLYYLKAVVSRKIIVLFSLFGIFHKIQIRFITNKLQTKFREKSLISKFRNKKRLNFVKEYILVNSRTFDIYKENKEQISDEYIILLDEQLNEPQWIRFREKFSENQLREHYENLNKLLNNLSQSLNKKVIITLHPNDDLEYKKDIFKNFEVVKYKTREFIYKSFLVIFFESSAISDAFLLNKNVAVIKSKILDINQKLSIDFFIKELQIPFFDIDQDMDKPLTKNILIKEGIIKNEEKLRSDYANYLENYVYRKSDNVKGFDRINNELNKRYFHK